jgi:putative addiction module CopG family antidote
MTVEIPPEFQQFVHQVIDSGSYQSEEAVVGEALRLLQRRQQRLEELRREIQPALDGLDRDEDVIELDDSELDAFFAEIEALSEAQLAAERKSQ